MDTYNKIHRDEYEKRIYEMYGDEYTVLEFTDLQHKARFRHNPCGFEYWAAPVSFMNGKGGCPVCVKGTTQTTESFKIRVFNKYGDDWKVDGKYINNHTPIPIIHKCGFRIKNRTPNAILGKETCTCPNCDTNCGGITISGINDVATTNPEIVDLLKNKNESYDYSAFSNHKTVFICPFCGEEIFTSFNNVSNNGLSCPRCGDGISYPEKFMFSLLSQFNIDFETQYSPDWIKPLKYDFFFEYNNKKYIIEMDGHYHYRTCAYSNLDEVARHDKFKDISANKHEITIIRIPCNYERISNRFDFIKESILCSKLNDVFDLKRADFNVCEKYALKNIVYEIANGWNNGIKSYDEFEEEYKIKRSSIRRYLKIASDCNLIKESYSEILNIIRKASNKKLAISKGQSVICNETGEIFNSYQEANKKYNAQVSNYFSKKYSHSGKLQDGTKLTWTKIL